MTESSISLEYTPTWVIAAVCFVIVLISLCAERGLHKLGKWLVLKEQIHLFNALEKLQEGRCNKPCANQCIQHLIYLYCIRGKVPLLSLEALHELHIFIFVLAVVHVIFCATTMVLGGIKMRQWKNWEEDSKTQRNVRPKDNIPRHPHHEFWKRTLGYWRKAAVVSWLISFFKQFYGSVTKSDYMALRQGFEKAYVREAERPEFDFYKYIMRKLEIDFRKVVGIRWHLWLFVVIFLLLNVEGWHTFFWLSFLPLVLLLLVGAKLEHIITRLAVEAEQDQVKPSDEHFWFSNPGIFLDLIHFILFQNAFEIAFFFWILCTYGIHSCIMERLGYMIPRLIIGVIVQVLCSYSTLPLYALVTQMGSNRIENEELISQSSTVRGINSEKSRTEGRDAAEIQMHKMVQESYTSIEVAEEMVRTKGPTASLTELSCVASP